MPLPGVLEAVGQVTFDDRLVSTIISRVTGRIEELRTSQWDTVRRGEQVMSLYSPDFMTAEAEYLEATSSAEPKRRRRYADRRLWHAGRQLQHGGEPEGRRRAQA